MAKNQGPDKSLQKAQAAERQYRGELMRKILDTWARIQQANGDRADDSPLLAIDAWPQWTQDSTAWQDFRETLLDLSDSTSDRALLESLFPVSGPVGESLEVLKLADQLVYNRQLAHAAARWREIQKTL